MADTNAGQVVLHTLVPTHSYAQDGQRIVDAADGIEVSTA